MSFEELGVTVCTCGVQRVFDKNNMFKDFALECLFTRYLNNDWGDMCIEDKELNDMAVKSGQDRIFASYNLPDYLQLDTVEQKIWIITEWDRSATTILFPSEY